MWYKSKLNCQKISKMQKFPDGKIAILMLSVLYRLISNVIWCLCLDACHGDSLWHIGSMGHQVLYMASNSHLLLQILVPQKKKKKKKKKRKTEGGGNESTKNKYLSQKRKYGWNGGKLIRSQTLRAFGNIMGLHPLPPHPGTHSPSPFTPLHSSPPPPLQKSGYIIGHDGMHVLRRYIFISIQCN